MRQSAKDFVGLCARSLPIGEPVFEFGAVQVPGQEGFADVRPLFAGKLFVGSDVRPGVGVDRILDLQQLELMDASVGTALVIDVLEHVEFVRRAVSEVLRVLKPGGVLIVTSTLRFPIHEYPHDYWRFTPDGLRSLLRPFESMVVTAAGGEAFPAVVAGVGCKGVLAAGPARTLAEGITAWKGAWRGRKDVTW